jgi:hypothetical protein
MAKTNDEYRRVKPDCPRLYPFKIVWRKWLEIKLTVDTYDFYWVDTLVNRAFWIYRPCIDWYDGNWVTDTLDNEWDIPF